MYFFSKKKTNKDIINIGSGIEKSILDYAYFIMDHLKVKFKIIHVKKNFNGRKIVFCREITKIYEEFIRKNVDELELFEKEPKGELTVVISEKKINKNLSQKLNESDKNMIKKMINKLSTKEITDILSKSTNVRKKEIYNYCLELKNEK